MAIKLTEKQLALLITALENRISELNSIINPLQEELAEHQKLIDTYKLTGGNRKTSDQGFELLPWSKKIIQILEETQRPMTANEITAEIIRRVPLLSEEPSTRSSIASILSRRTGKLFKKIDDKYTLM
jgi:hypothetical protein